MKTNLEILILALEIRGSLIDSGETDFEGESLECWNISVNPRLTSCAGKCFYEKKEIQLSGCLFSGEDNFLTELRETVLHEFAHAIVGRVQKYGRKNRSPHGWEFKSALIRIGGNGERCHTMKVNKKARKKAIRHEVFCGRCRNILPMGNTQYRRMLDGLTYRHGKCGGPLFTEIPKTKLVSVPALLPKIPLKKLGGMS